MMKKERATNNYIAVVNIIFSLLMLPLFLYSMVGTVAFGAEPMKAINNNYVYILSISGLVIFIIMAIFNSLSNSYRPNYVLIVVLLLLFIANSLTIAFFKTPVVLTISSTSDNIKQIYYVLDAQTRIKFIFQFAVVLTMTFLIVDFYPKIFKTVNLLYLCAFGMIIFSIFLTVYSLLNETEFYKNYLFNLISEDGQIVHAQSLLPNKNSYSIMLFAGMVASLFLHNRKHKIYWFIPATYLFFFIMISFCKTLIIIAPLFYLFYLFFRFLISFKEHKARNLTVFTIFAVGFIILGIFVIQLKRIYPNIIEHIYTVVFKNSDTYSSIDARESIWINSYNLISNYNIVFGLGFNVYGDILYEFMYGELTEAWQHTYAHNTIIEILGDGGLIFLAAYCYLLGYIIYASVKIFPEYKTTAMFSLLMCAAMLGISIVESGSFIFPYSGEFVFYSAVTFVPTLNKYYQMKKTSLLAQLEFQA